MDSNRLRRVEAQVQKDLAEVFRELAQSRFRGVLFTVTGVRISADLSVGRVNLSLFPVKDKNEIIEWANEQEAHIKDALVRKMEGTLRRMPRLHFYLDESLDREAEIDRILKGGGESPIK